MCGVRVHGYIHCTRARARMCSARGERTEDLFLVPRAAAFLTKVSPVRCTSRSNVPMTDLDRRL